MFYPAARRTIKVYSQLSASAGPTGSGSSRGSIDSPVGMGDRNTILTHNFSRQAQGLLAAGCRDKIVLLDTFERCCMTVTIHRNSY